MHQRNPRTIAPLIVFAIIAGAVLTLTLNGRWTHADGPLTSFSVDADPTVPGIQNSRSVPVGSTFNVEVVLDAHPGPNWEAYQVTMDYDDVKIDGKLPLDPPPAASDTGWTMTPVQGVNGGNTFTFTMGASCIPSTQAASRFGEDDNGLANWAMTCAESVAGTAHSGIGPLVQFSLKCEAAGPAPLTLHDNVDTFLLDPEFNQYGDHVHNAVIDCQGPATNTAHPKQHTDADEYAHEHADAHQHANEYADAGPADEHADADADQHADEYADADANAHEYAHAGSADEHTHADAH